MQQVLESCTLRRSRIISKTCSDMHLDSHHAIVDALTGKWYVLLGWHHAHFAQSLLVNK
jgi:hypothetical protein